MEDTQFRSLPRGRIHLLIALIAYRDSACVSIRSSHDTGLVFGMALTRTAPRRRRIDSGNLSHIGTILVPESWHTITKWGPVCRTLLPAPCPPNRCPAPWFLHGNGFKILYSGNVSCIDSANSSSTFFDASNLFIAVTIQGWLMIHYRLR